jgi:hypothetical protein
VTLNTPEDAKPATLGIESDASRLMPQLLQLNRELAAHGTTVKPDVEIPEMVATPRL